MSNLAQIDQLRPSEQPRRMLTTNLSHTVDNLAVTIDALPLPHQFKLICELQAKLLPSYDEPHYIVYNVGEDSELEVSTLMTTTSMSIMNEGITARELSSQVLYVSDGPSASFNTHAPAALTLYKDLTRCGITTNGVVVQHQGADSVLALIPIIKECPGFSLLSDYPIFIETRYVLMDDAIKSVMILHFE